MQSECSYAAVYYFLPLWPASHCRFFSSLSSYISSSVGALRNWMPSPSYTTCDFSIDASTLARRGIPPLRREATSGLGSSRTRPSSTTCLRERRNGGETIACGARPCGRSGRGILPPRCRRLREACRRQNRRPAMGEVRCFGKDARMSASVRTPNSAVRPTRRGSGTPCGSRQGP